METDDRVPTPDEEEQDPALERLQEGRLPGEIESGMMTGSDDSEISSTERFEGDMTEREVLQALYPDESSPLNES
jgi:hypothetical protein